MKSNVRHTFRPNLEALEDRLVPMQGFSWGIVSSPDFAAVLTAAQPAPALSSFSWGLVGNPDFLHTMSVGPTTVVAAFPMESVSL